MSTLICSAGAFDFIGAPATQDFQTDNAAGQFTFSGLAASLPGSPVTSGGTPLEAKMNFSFLGFGPTNSGG